MRVGLIGGGNISETHARAAREIPSLEIVAVYGTNREKVVRMSAQYGASPYCDFEQFLGHKPMDFVAIGSPSGLHAEQGVSAARRGLHVLTEKPLEISTQTGREVIAAAKEAGVRRGVFFQGRCQADVLQANT